MRDVRFGSKADMCSAEADVRFTPNSGHVQCNSACPLCADSGHTRQNRDYEFGQLALNASRALHQVSSVLRQ